MRRLLFLCALALCTSRTQAQTVDLSLAPATQIAEIGDLVEIQIQMQASGIVDVDLAAIDALIDYDPQYLLLTGVDDLLSNETWFASAFLPDPDGINLSISDGNALYTALCQPGVPATAAPAGEIVTTLQFIALQSTLETSITFLATMGSYGTTDVYDYHQAGGVITGDISSKARVRIIAPPTQYCLGEPSTCPCGNQGGPGAGCQNSTGLGATLTATGSTSVIADDIVLHSVQCPTSTFGIFIVGGGALDQPFGDGLLCVSPGPTGLHRFTPPNHTGAGGTMNRGPGIVAYTNGFPSGQEIQAGNTYYFQAWYRDGSGPCSTGWNLTNALEVTFTP